MIYELWKFKHAWLVKFGKHRGLKIPRPFGLAGSSPALSIGSCDRDVMLPSSQWTVAQLVEPPTVNRVVVGSSPTGSVKLINE